jgi:hypothetical protein
MTSNHGKWDVADLDSQYNPLDDMYYHRIRKKGTLPERPLGLEHGLSNSSINIENNRDKAIRNAGLAKNSMSKVSEERAEYIRGIMDRQGGPRENYYLRPELVRERSVFKMMKNAGLLKTATSGAVPLGSTTDTINIAPELYSPLFLTQNLQLPRDIITANAWNRAFYETNPIVRNAINLHATYPISKMNIKCEDKKVEQFFLDMMEKVDLEAVVQYTALEFWKHGEKIHKNSMITMADGTLKRIVDVQIGDKVLTHTGKKKKVTNRWAKPTSTVIEEDLKIYKIHIRGLDEPLIISGRHPIFSSHPVECDTPSCKKKKTRILPGKTKCSNCGKKYNPSKVTPDFVDPIDLKSGDLLYAPFDKTIKDVNTIDDALCYIIGQWLAEGCYCKVPRKNYTKYNGIKFCSYNKEYITDVLEPLLEKVFGHSPTTYESKSTRFVIGKPKYDTWYEAECRNGPAIADFFYKNCGEYSKTKKVSEMIMQLPPSRQLHLLAGFVDGDGCIDQQNGHIIMCTSSRSLANQFMMMLRRAGARPSISKVKSKTDGKEASHYNYRIKVVANEAYDLFKNKLRSEKNDLLQKSKWCSPRTAVQDCWQITNITKIEDITDNFKDEFMYDIEVEDDHSYVANGIAIHNCFVYASFDESTGSWGKIYHHNPDFISVKSSPIPGSVTIALRPDPELEKIITSSDPAHIRIRESLDPRIVHHVLMNEYIPLDSFNISHLKNLSAPYDVRGTSIIVSVWKDLMLYDKLRECHDVETEVLTRDGFKTYTEVISQRLDTGDVVPNPGLEIACFNGDSGKLEYHKPTRAMLYDYSGDMIHFKGKNVDIKVTPNHRMNVSKKGNKGWGEWHEELAGDMSNHGKYRFRSQIEWDGVDANEVEIGGVKLPIKLFLEFVGYVLSDGCIFTEGFGAGKNNLISLTQAFKSKKETSQRLMRECLELVALLADRKCSSHIYHNKYGTKMWQGTLHHKGIALDLCDELGHFKNTKSKNKKIPRWILELSPNLLSILLDALVVGDGYIKKGKDGSIRKEFYTSSKQLADDVYESAYKCGYTPSLTNREVISKYTGKLLKMYTVFWSNTSYGNFPTVSNSDAGASFTRVPYNDKVWCFEVPTGMFITRRNGRITVQYNSKFVQADGMVNPVTLIKVGASNPDGHYPTREELETYREVFEQAQYDKDFKIVTHDAVNVERVGYSGQVLDTSADFQMIIDNILMGLMIPKAIITQEGATYASASVALDVMRQRYNNFRTLMANWLEKKIFAPISEVQQFYKYEGGVKRLIVPQVEWNHMTLYDLDNYLGHILGLVDKKGVSMETVYRSLGLNSDNEEANIREESIRRAIQQKEEFELHKMNLGELRSLDPTKPIPEKPVALPGTPGGPGGPPGEGMEGLMPPGGGMPGGGGPLPMGGGAPPGGPMGGPPGGGPGLAMGPGGPAPAAPTGPTGGPDDSPI